MKHKMLKTAIRNVIISVAVYLILSFLVVMILYEGMFARSEEYDYHSFISYEDMNGYTCRETEFDSGGFTLSCRIYNEDGQEGTVVIGHGSLSSSGEDMLAEAKYFADNGFAAMVFDLTGHGKSSGVNKRGLCQAVSDMESAVRFCENDEKLSGKPLFLYGFGASGYSAAICSAKESVCAAAAVSAFDSVTGMTLEYACSKMSVFGYLEYPVMLLYQYLIFGDKVGLSAFDAINASKTPIIVIHSSKDEVVSVSGASILAKSGQITREGFRTIELSEGSHSSLMRTEDARAYMNEFNNEAMLLSQQYNGNVPSFLIEDIYERYDRGRMSSLNTEIMDEIRDLFLSAAANG